MLVNALARANKEEQRARTAFASPYSSHDLAVEFYESRGYQRGLAKAIEILDGNPGTVYLPLAHGCFKRMRSGQWRFFRYPS